MDELFSVDNARVIGLTSQILASWLLLMDAHNRKARLHEFAWAIYFVSRVAIVISLLSSRMCECGVDTHNIVLATTSNVFSIAVIVYIGIREIALWRKK